MHTNSKELVKREAKLQTSIFVYIKARLGKKAEIAAVKLKAL